MKSMTAYLRGALLAAVCVAAQAADANLLKVTSIDIDRQGPEGNSLAVALTIDPRSVNPGRDREVVFTPVIISDQGTDTVTLAPIRISGRNRYYSHLRNHDLPEGATIYEAGTKEPIVYNRQTPFLPWMMKCRVDMQEQTARCCDPIEPAGITPLAEIDYEQPQFPAMFNNVMLTGDEAVERKAEGSAFIDFIVNRTEIKDTYRDNKQWLDTIIKTIDLVKKDPDAVITKITIKGYASPEGSYSNNVRLAMGRTQALKEYVLGQIEIDRALMHTDYEPEDWEGFERRLRAIELPHKQEILDIIASPLEPDPKNAEIERRFPREYDFIHDSIYPALRHSDYTVNYNIRTFVDIDELKRVYAADPTKLRPVDFQRIASTYPAESPEQDEVYLTASRIYPLDPEAAVNAANIYMRQRRYDLAADRLRYAGESPEAQYSRATLAALNGDLTRARDLFARTGTPAAEAEAAKIDGILNRTKVTYLITPEQK